MPFAPRAGRDVRPPGTHLVLGRSARLTIGWLTALGGTYGLLAWAVLVAQGETSPAFFPAAGVTLAFMYVTNGRDRAAAAIVIGFVELVLDVVHGFAPGHAVLLASANAIEPIIGAVLLNRWFGRARSMPAPSAVVRFTAAAAVATAVSSVIGGSTLAAATAGSWWSNASAWWLGDMLGIVVAAPLVLLVAARVRPPGRRCAEMVAAVALAIAAVVVIFFVTSLPLSWALFVLMGWMATRYGSLGAAVMSMVVVGAAVTATTSGEGFLGNIVGRANGPLLVQLMLVCLVVGGHLLAAEVQYATRTAAAASDGEASLRAVIDEAPIPIIQIDGRDSTVLSWNAAAETTFGLDADDVIGRPLPVGDDRSDHVARRDRAIANPADRRYSVTRRARNGSTLHLDVALLPRTTVDGRTVLMGIVHDRTADLIAEAELRSRLATDALTGLANRTVLEERLASLIGHSGGDEQFVAVFCDLDGFKLVNDTLGHQVGDELLVAVARRLQRCVRPGDLVARLGGDEFVILAAMSLGADVESMASRVRDAFEIPFVLGHQVVPVGISIGHAEIRNNMSAAAVLARADAAMYDDKRSRFQLSACAGARPGRGAGSHLNGES